MRVKSLWNRIVFGGCSLGLSACLFQGGGVSKPVPDGGVSVQLRIREASLAKGAASAAALSVDSVHVRVTAADMEPAHFGFRGSEPTLSINDLKAGQNRLFEVKLFLHGELLYAGSAVASLATDRVNAFTVHALPQFSRVNAS